MCQEQVERALQQSGKRITQQRKILLDVILNGDWECCKEIYYKAVKKDPKIGAATVYRTRSLHWNGNRIPHDDNIRRDWSHREKMCISC